MQFNLKEKQISILIIVLGILIILLGRNLISKNTENNRNEILNGEYEICIGKYKSVWKAGLSGSTYIEVEYSVAGKLYSESVKSRHYYQLCRESQECNEKYFLVIYSKENPDQALIDLSKEVDINLEVKKPLSTGNFK
ncbi:hypothetical protein [Carboxylicivirga marina]|uniref:hypothetical protein n=1 Tax=Carboxylicivirga marina TaxID=2800988 RepID=UPI002594F8BD|nr:hypothetical protein [uncultured Carboxylicivirga sp.]